MWSDSWGICTDASGNPHSWLASNGSSECLRRIWEVHNDHFCASGHTWVPHITGVPSTPWSPADFHPDFLPVSQLGACLQSRLFCPKQGAKAFSTSSVHSCRADKDSAGPSTLPLPVFPLNYSGIGSASGCMFQSLISRFQFITLSISWHQPRDSPLSPVWIGLHLKPSLLALNGNQFCKFSK